MGSAAAVIVGRTSPHGYEWRAGQQPGCWGLYHGFQPRAFITAVAPRVGNGGSRYEIDAIGLAYTDRRRARTQIEAVSIAESFA